jgi:hypothetical protein
VRRLFVVAKIAHHRSIKLDDCWCFGPDVAQVGEGFHSPDLRCILIILHGLERAVFGSLGRNRIRILRLKFSVFSFFGK